MKKLIIIFIIACFTNCNTLKKKNKEYSINYNIVSTCIKKLQNENQLRLLNNELINVNLCYTDSISVMYTYKQDKLKYSKTKTLCGISEDVNYCLDLNLNKEQDRMKYNLKLGSEIVGYFDGFIDSSNFVIVSSKLLYIKDE